MTDVVRADLTEHPIDAAEHEALVAHHAAGAVVSFAGVVRDHDGGRSVTRLEYSAHPSAAQVLAYVAAEVAAEADGVRALAVSHRVGALQIGDANGEIGVSGAFGATGAGAAAAVAAAGAVPGAVAGGTVAAIGRSAWRPVESPQLGQ